jgi:hypothetical protein
MTNLTLIVILCITLLALLRIVLRRGRQEQPGDLLDMPVSLDYQVRLPGRFLLARCLSSEDLEFVTERKSSQLLHLFVRERRRLAVGWLRQIRREASRLYRLHVRSVRYAADLRPAAEAKLLLAVILFSVVYGAMLLAVELYGPFRTKRFLQSVQSMADVLVQLGGRIAASIAPAGLPDFGAAAGGR